MFETFPKYDKNDETWFTSTSFTKHLFYRRWGTNKEDEEENAEEELFAWAGEFRSRDEIVQLYNERKKWDRRFLIDTYALGIVLLLATAGLGLAFEFIAPRPNFEKDVSATAQAELINSQTNQ